MIRQRILLLPPTFYINFRLHIGLVESGSIYSLHLAFLPSHCPIALHVRLAEPRSLYSPVHLYVTTLPKLNPLLSFCCEFLGLGGGLHLRSEMKSGYFSEVKQIVKYRLHHILQWRVACVAGVERGRGRGNLGARSRALIPFPFPFEPLPRRLNEG